MKQIHLIVLVASLLVGPRAAQAAVWVVARPHSAVVVVRRPVVYTTYAVPRVYYPYGYRPYYGFSVNYGYLYPYGPYAFGPYRRHVRRVARRWARWY